MAWPSEQYFAQVVALAQQTLSQVKIKRYDLGENRSVLDLDGQWRKYRIVVSEIHRINLTVRYAYYIFDKSNQLVHGFDNSRDKEAIQLCYGIEAKLHSDAEIPHQHDRYRQVTLTPTAMTFEMFVAWLKANLE